MLMKMLDKSLGNIKKTSELSSYIFNNILEIKKTGRYNINYSFKIQKKTYKICFDIEKEDLILNYIEVENPDVNRSSDIYEYDSLLNQDSFLKTINKLITKNLTKEDDIIPND